MGVTARQLGRLTREELLKQARSALDEGDHRSAMHAVSSIRDLDWTERRYQRTAGRAPLAVKAGARHSRADAADMQAIHDLAVKQGAACGGMMKAIGAPLAVKAVGNGKIEGLLVRFTSPSELDLVGDYFDAQSNLGLEDGDALPLLWHHGLDPEIGKNAIGKGTVKRTPAGWWFTAWLNMRSEYEKYIYKMAELGKLGYSSQADPSTVVRVPVSGKANAHYLKSWWVIEGSVTPTPMDPGNNISIKSLMGSRADDLRRRRLMLELDVLQLEAEATKPPKRAVRPEPPALLVPGPTSGSYFAPFDWRNR
jgi:hypothetical protein